jgi:hypothetical protein
MNEAQKTVELMTEKEAREIARMTRDELYPPTNRNVLWRACITINLLNGMDDDIKCIMDWLLELEPTIKGFRSNLV